MLTYFFLLSTFFFLFWCDQHFCRKQPCLMLGMKCCQSCTWWQCYHYHRLIYYFFQEHPVMVISRKYQKVSNTEFFLVHVDIFLVASILLLFITPNNQNTILSENWTPPPPTYCGFEDQLMIKEYSWGFQLILFLLCMCVVLWLCGLFTYNSYTIIFDSQTKNMAKNMF